MADRLPHPAIVMTPPVQPGAAPSTSNPRRPPAHRSVSLLHASRPKPLPPRVPSDSSSDSVVHQRRESGSKESSDSPSSLQPLGRDSSGESSNAEKWFEKSNNEINDNSATFDNDPPFFLRHSSSSETPPEVLQQQMRQLQDINDESNPLLFRTGIPHLGTGGSCNEDFRGVIDDLTVENKKLKRRLKRYEKLHDSHLRDEKLFEVRIHGLPPDKKRELEDTLRKFAIGLGTNGFPPNGYEGLMPALNSQKTASQTSFHNADSAYASMSGSGQGSTVQSGAESGYRPTGLNTASRRENIHSYLHHIPKGLLPQPAPLLMTERAKKKLVVRRLEQIFAGKGATLGGHQHPLQQQEVSQMAARADRAENEAQGQRSHREGSREAHIMETKAEEAAVAADDHEKDGHDFSPDKVLSNSLQEKTAALGPKGILEVKGSYDDQRPTRPLDLDPARAQVPADNIRYMRHLGFSPPEPGSPNLPVEGHGWVYLNLLINMAQLHTINVTAEFVRKALNELSSKFEISRDGRKVRWKGGKSVTRTSSSGGGSSTERTGTDTPDRASPRKRPKLSHRDTDRSAVSNPQAGASKSQRTRTEYSKLAYSPLFFHRSSSEDMDDSSEDEDNSGSSPYPGPAAGDSSGMTSSGIRTTSTKRKKNHNDGPIIFYNNARFCTDLSGDRKAHGSNGVPYTTASSLPLGKPKEPPTSHSNERRGPLAQAAELPEPMDIGDNPIPESMELEFPPRSPREQQKGERMEPLEMEVTGIGGVWPSDNFAIAVESRHAYVDQDSTAHGRNGSAKYLPERLARILRKPGKDHRVHEDIQKHHHIIVTGRKDLPPSQLPPALGFPFGDDSFGDDSSDADEDEVSASPESPHVLPPSAAPQPVELPYSLSDEEEEEEDYEYDSEEDSSLDLLAAARQLDPEAIREQEREYDANMAERLAEEIPAGSSAATAGGGSGFASPASANGMDREQYKRALKEAKGRPGGLKRAKSSDSIEVQNPKNSDSDDSADGSDREMEE